MSENTQNAAEIIAQNQIKQRRNKRLAALGGVVTLAAIGVATYWMLYGSHFVSTDNAYAAAEVAAITPAVGGTVLDVKVTDTQAVKKGDVLLQIDPTDAKLALAQAEAELNQAIRHVKSLVATGSNLGAQIKARQADFERAKVDLVRRQALVESGSVSGDDLTRAKNAFDTATANLKSATAAKEANAVLIADTTADNHPEVMAARARLEQATVDLNRTTLVSPVDGVVARRQVQVGQRVQIGMPLMVVVPVNEIYVDANFKEVQLKKVKTGQPVKLHADIYGKNVTYHGVVAGFSGGSGSAFAAIPAQNATGNWIKVVQRLPVRIQLDPKELQAHPLKVGLSMNAVIYTRGER